MSISHLNGLSVRLIEEKSDLIRVGIIGNEINRLVDYLNELSRVYIAFNLNQKNKTTKNTINFIDQQLDFLVDSLKYTGKEFSDFRKSKK